MIDRIQEAKELTGMPALVLIPAPAMVPIFFPVASRSGVSVGWLLLAIASISMANFRVSTLDCESLKAFAQKTSHLVYKPLLDR